MRLLLCGVVSAVIVVVGVGRVRLPVVILVVRGRGPRIVLLGHSCIAGGGGKFVVLGGGGSGGVHSVGVLGRLLLLRGGLLLCVLRGLLLNVVDGRFLSVLVFLSLVDRVHAVVLVGLAFVVLFFFGGEYLPGRSDQACHRSSLGWDPHFRLFETSHVRRKEHVVSRLVALAIGLLVGGLVFSHLFVVPFPISLGSFSILFLLVVGKILPEPTRLGNQIGGRYPFQLGVRVRALQGGIVFLSELFELILHKNVVGRQGAGWSRLVLAFPFVGLLALRNKSLEFGDFVHELGNVDFLPVQEIGQGALQHGFYFGIADDFLIGNGLWIGVFVNDSVV
mmetsp:Transcript_1833/g.3686  ORF Transcript_1833/g.3686 Transcript_1833/m.3686 type:complete len:335 (+) Transcript_1833:244-1248(+)